MTSKEALDNIAYHLVGYQKELCAIAKDLDKYNKILEIINEYKEEEKKPINIIPAQYVVNEILEVLENDL